MAMISSMQRVLGTMKHKCGYFAIAAFLVEAYVLSWSIQRSRIIQQKENRSRIGLALNNYSLR